MIQAEALQPCTQGVQQLLQSTLLCCEHLSTTSRRSLAEAEAAVVDLLEAFDREGIWQCCNSELDVLGAQGDTCNAGGDSEAATGADDAEKNIKVRRTFCAPPDEASWP